MNCRDIMKLPELKDVLILRAGEDGLNHNIRWIYFADCLQCVKSEYRMEDYIHGSEFVVLTNPKLTGDTVALRELIEKMRAFDIAALGINEGQISDEMVDYCDRYKLPLFELPEKYALVDLSQILCQQLVLEEHRRGEEKQGFYNLIAKIDDDKALDDFVEAQLGLLLRADQVRDSSLSDTLRQYLNHNCNAKETAEAMFLHRNTLNYRLSRIKEILGVDFDTLEDLVNLKLAFAILEYQGGHK